MEVGERGCNLQLVKLEKYSIQGLNSSKLYRIWLAVSTHLKNICQLEIFLNSVGVKIKNLWNHYLRFFLADLDISECKATKCKPCSPLHCQSNSMTSRCSSQSCWLSMLRQGPVKKKCQTMSNHVKPESLQCDLRQYTATGGCNHGKPTKIHEPNHTVPTTQRVCGSLRKFYSFMAPKF